MGRKRKFGEESDFVSVRVPKSKRKEYRNAIKSFVEKKFMSESTIEDECSGINVSKKKVNSFRKFEEFMKNIRNVEKEKDDG